jgi:hypothetical protein
VPRKLVSCVSEFFFTTSSRSGQGRIRSLIASVMILASLSVVGNASAEHTFPDIVETFDSGPPPPSGWACDNSMNVISNSNCWSWGSGGSLPPGYTMASPSLLADTQWSVLAIDASFPGPGYVDFDFMTDSELNYDKLQFKIDGITIFSSSGLGYPFFKSTANPSDWSGGILPETYIPSAGVHRVEFRYTKDVIFSSGQDRAWVDNVRFTPDNVPVDSDGDGVLDQFDNCPTTFNPDQADNEPDGFGDVCDPDDDNDQVLDSSDNCQFDSNASQANFDFDSMGDVCDPDDDNDGYTDVEEINAGTNPRDPVSNPLDSDGDGVFNFQDNCPSYSNPAQYDRDFDQQGNVCDPQPGPPGSIFVWGSDDPGVFQVSATPSSSDFIAIAGGGGHSLALTAQGRIVGWGFDGTAQISGRPINSGHTQIASGSGFGLALTSGGAIVAWGDNTYGQVSGKPGGTGFVAISAFGYEAAALRADGSVVVWGRNQYGHVSNAPTGTGFVAVDVGVRQSVALTSSGQIVTWGDNTFNQISLTPTGTGYLAVSSGFAHVLALTSSGAIVSWGSASYGLPNVPGGTGYSAISAGNGHSSALTFNGSLVEWGGESPSWADFRLFDPPIASGFTAISEGHFHVVALYDAAPPPCDDGDGDGVCYPPDNCPLNYNPLQLDNEQDGLGDVCDPDDDNDGFSDVQDNCQFDFNPSQGNFDFDPMGDLCDPDDDNDGYTDVEEINAGSDPRDSNSTPAQSGPTLAQFNAAGGYAAYLANPSNVDLRLAGVCDEAQAFAHWRDSGFAQGRTFASGGIRTDRLNGSLDPNYAIDGGFAWEYPGANTVVFITGDAPKPAGWAGSALLLQRCQTFNIGSFYSAEIYRNINPDVRNAIDQGLVPSFQSVTDHYVKYGFKEGRLTNSDWTAAQLNAWSDPGYLAANPDVANYFQGAANAGWSLFGKYGFAHWINFGRYEGRNNGQP